MKTEINAFLSKVNNFSKAAYEMLLAWEKIEGDDRDFADGGLYPFDSSFDEVVAEIQAWYVTLITKAEVIEYSEALKENVINLESRRKQ